MTTGSQRAEMAVTYRGSGQPGRPVDRRTGAIDRVPPLPPDTPRQRRSGRMWLAAWQIARWLPEPVAFGIAEIAGRLGARRGGRLRARVAANLSHVVGADTLDATVNAAFGSYARYWVEAFRAADIGADDIHDRVTTDGMDLLDDVLAHGRGAVVLLAHHGSWDIAARWAEAHEYHLAVVAEVVRPQALFARFVALREQIGLEVVPLVPRRTGGTRGIPARLGEVLADNHLVGLLSDRDLSGTAPLVEFFGRSCHLPIGPAVLARRHRAPVVPISMLQRPGRRWHLQVLQPRWLHTVPLGEAHRAVAAALEDLIRLDPAQWHAFQPIWPTDGAAGTQHAPP